MKPSELRQFRACLRVIERHAAGALKEQTICCGVTSAQCHVLLEFCGSEALTNSGLSNRLRLDPSTLSRTVDSLVKSGMISRSENPQNRRSADLTLTKKGKEKLQFINESCDRFYKSFLERIPREKYADLLEALCLLSNLFSDMENSCFQNQNESSRP